MSNLLQTADEIRRMSESELAQVAEDGLTTRLREQAEAARIHYQGLRPSNIATFLSDRNHVRHPTRLVLELGEMGPHQFAQPEPDIRNPGGIMLYLRPMLGKRPDYMVQAIAYMIPVINYGKLITDEHCITYGATLFGVSRAHYYNTICEIADWVGAETAQATNNPSTCHCS